MSHGKSILWVFCLGSGPVLFVVFWFCRLLRCFRWRNASLAGGFAGRRVWLVAGSFWCVVLIDLPFQWTLYVLVQMSFLLILM